MNPPVPSAPGKEWDQVRAAFSSSLMVNTPLASLAQNLDGLDWPFAGEAEIPATYIDLTHEELVRFFAGRGQPQAAALLVQILRETLEFDQPFNEMANQAEVAAELDNPLRRALARLNIPEEFPITLTTLDGPTRELCQLEHIRTLGHFALFAQGLSQTVIVGGDFRRLLNALAQLDEKNLAALVPFRPGTTGLHLVEALVQAARSENSAEHTAHAIAWFGQEFAEWRCEAAKSPRFLPRQLATLNDEALEQRIAKLLTPRLAAAPVEPSKSIMARLSRWFGC